eukprot:6177716-Pleurochrysis_carterae.AAC.4
MQRAVPKKGGCASMNSREEQGHPQVARMRNAAARASIRPSPTPSSIAHFNTLADSTAAAETSTNTVQPTTAAHLEHTAGSYCPQTLEEKARVEQSSCSRRGSSRPAVACNMDATESSEISSALV